MTERSSHRSAAPMVRASVGTSAAGAAVAVILPTLLSLAFGGASYAGAHDDAVAATAQTRYGAYLGDVMAAMSAVAASQLVVLFLAVLGPSLAWRVSGRAPVRGWRAFALHAACAHVLLASWFMHVAEKHPGLFLSQLSRVPGCYWLLAIGDHLFTLLGAGVVLAYGYAAARGTLRVKVVVALAASLVGAILFARERFTKRYVHRPYGTVAVAEPAAVPPPAPARPRARPNILWIAVDSLRPDKIDEKNTPHIARLVNDSVYFPNTLVTVPRTGPSWVASMTSMSPLTNGVETMFPDHAAGELATIGMPAHLASLGYRTAVFSDYAGEFFGRVDLGFQLRSVPEVELREISGQLLLGNAPLVLAQIGALYTAGPAERSLLGERLTTLVRGMASFTHPSALEDDLSTWVPEQDAPFFGLVFYSQPHFPYASNSPYYRRYHVPGSSSSITFGRDVTNETPITSAEDERQIEGLYRGALAESDDAIGRLLARLERDGRLDDTIVILSADHGEGLYDCPSCVGHGDNLRGMFTLRVPLAIRLPQARYPAGTPRVVESYVSQLDVYPTILALLRRQPVALHEGVALLASDGAPRDLPRDRVFFAETGEWLWTTPAVPKERLEYPPITQLATLERGRIVIDPKYAPVIRAAKHRAAIRWPYKLAYEPRKEGVQHHLYKLDEDPLELQDIAAREPAVRDELVRALRLDMLRHPHLMSVRDFLVTRPPPPPEED